jgi:integrase
VFGKCGRQVKNTKHAWTNACTRAGIVDLHFHDLRHEAASRLHDAGWPLHHVRDMLGHSEISQTDTYLNATKKGLRESMERFDPSRCNPVPTESNQEPPLDCNEEQTETPKPLIN